MLDKVFACVAVIIGLSLCMNGAVRLLGRLWLPYERKHKPYRRYSGGMDNEASGRM